MVLWLVILFGRFCLAEEIRAGDVTDTNTSEIGTAESADPTQTRGDSATDQEETGSFGASSSADPATNQEIQEYISSQTEPPGLMEGESHTSSLGLELRDDIRSLSTGEEVKGVLVLKVYDGSPAADAGLRGHRAAVQALLLGAAAATAIVLFPPAILAIPVVDQTHVGESYDMIIGVDGQRVKDYLEFEAETRDIKPGDIVYLSIVRDGKRAQVPVYISSTASSPAYSKY